MLTFLEEGQITMEKTLYCLMDTKMRMQYPWDS